MGREIETIFNFDATEEEMCARIIARSKEHARPDDNEETVKHRIKLYNSTTKTATDYYTKFNKVAKIDAHHTIE